jgi:hypothetical protein
MSGSRILNQILGLYREVDDLQLQAKRISCTKCLHDEFPIFLACLEHAYGLKFVAVSTVGRLIMGDHALYRCNSHAI